MTDRNADSRTFPFYRFTGTHRAIGRQYGEACAPLIRRHRDLALERLQARAGITAEQALARALRYRPVVCAYAPFFDEEIQGVAEGAGLSLAEAYLLQLRAEVARPLVEDEAGAAADGCTSFACVGQATADGASLVGQTDDLPAFYAEIGVVLELAFADMPAVLMFTPAGQVSHLGINDRGLGAFANYLTSDGWRLGFPRYLLVRLLLQHATVDAALAALPASPRATSRNYILADASGGAADWETTPTAAVRLDPADGLLCHTNHYTAPALLAAERSRGRALENSRLRLARMRELLAANHGRLDPAMLREMLGDPGIVFDPVAYPDGLCRLLGRGESDSITAAAIVAEPSRGQMWVAAGPPNRHCYQRYAFAEAPVRA